MCNSLFYLQFVYVGQCFAPTPDQTLQNLYDVSTVWYKYCFSILYCILMKWSQQNQWGNHSKGPLEKQFIERKEKNFFVFCTWRSHYFVINVSHKHSSKSRHSSLLKQAWATESQVLFFPHFLWNKALGLDTSIKQAFH